MEVWMIVCEIIIFWRTCVSFWWKCELFCVKLQILVETWIICLWNCPCLMEVRIIFCETFSFQWKCELLFCEMVNFWWGCELFFVKLSIVDGNVNYFLWNCQFWWKCELFWAEIDDFRAEMKDFRWKMEVFGIFLCFSMEKKHSSLKTVLIII